MRQVVRSEGGEVLLARVRQLHDAIRMPGECVFEEVPNCASISELVVPHVVKGGQDPCCTLSGIVS